MVSAMITAITDLIDALVADIPTLFAVVIPFVVGIVLFVIAKKWFFGGSRRV